MPASVTVEGGGSGSYLNCFSDASLEPPARSRSTILMFWESTLCLLYPTRQATRATHRIKTYAELK